MDLNNNPRVSAEKRLRQLIARRRKLLDYVRRRFDFVYEHGTVTKMYIDPYIKIGKGNDLIDKINKEINFTENYLKKFR